MSTLDTLPASLDLALGETKTINVDFTPYMASSETITAARADMINTSTGATLAGWPPGGVISGAIGISASLNLVQITLVTQPGSGTQLEVGPTYRLQVQITTNQGNVLIAAVPNINVRF